MEYSGQYFDVIVIGAGIMGSSTAYNTSKRGRKTLLLEQFDFLHHRGSSHGESRTLRTTYPEDYYSSMVLESLQLWQEAEKEIGYRVYFKTPQFDMGPAENKSLNSVINSCKKNSVPHRVLDAHQVDEMSSRIQIPGNWIGVSTEFGGVVKPTKAVSMFQTLAVKHGAVLRDNQEVVDIKKDNSRNGVLVCTRNGEIYRGDKCVVTVGAWMKKLVESVSGVVLPIQPLETNVCYWKIKKEHESEFTIAGGFPTFASYGEPYIYGTPSLEYPGMIKISVHGGRNCDPENRTWKVAPAVLESLKIWIDGRFGDRVDSVKPVLTQSCLYSMTPDEDFVIDFLGGMFEKDVVVAGGFSGHGFKMGPVVGQILADLVINGMAKGVELKHFEIGRFKINPRGNFKEFEDQVTKCDDLVKEMIDGINLSL